MDSTWDSDACDLDDGLVIPGGIGASAPPAVYSFEELKDFRVQTKDAVIIAVDFECVDHLNQQFGKDFYGKMSEIGIATYDPRQSTSLDTGNIAKDIAAQHIIVEEWKGITERTCPAFFHRKNTKKPNKAPAPHKARPYHCMFARSTIGLSKEQGMERLKDAIRQATVSNLTADEKETGAERQVRIIVWCAEREEKVFSQAGVHLDELGSDVKMWDFQIWMPFRLRFPHYRTAGETAFASLGVVGALDSEGQPSTVLHNATKDTVAEVLAFLRFMVMTEAEWSSWLDQKVDLTPMSFDWVDQTVYQHNIAQNPMPKPTDKGRGKPRGGKSYMYNTRQPRRNTASQPSNKTTTTAAATKISTSPATRVRLVIKETPNSTGGPSTLEKPDSDNIASTNGWGNSFGNGSGSNPSEGQFSGWPKTPNNDGCDSSSSSGPKTPSEYGDEAEGPFSGWPKGSSDYGDESPFSGWPKGSSEYGDESPLSGWPKGTSNGSHDHVGNGWRAHSSTGYESSKTETSKENTDRDRVLNHNDWWDAYNERSRNAGVSFKANGYRGRSAPRGRGNRSNWR
ncbi:hypothetical protein B0H65DRAFT_551637 [Neurospora tetraspora]|uniref:Uncharacterized protein n=1 Tax=Neurospora tetraspora TaxID=94610 RepID=A0AAE0MNM9_9PEZI|nr:hypothetical protein B0H65DRAFT_551637 [Neurospora tetraspora]